MAQTGYEQQTERLVFRDNTEEKRAKAQRIIASFALNHEDREELLSALGLLNKK